MLEQGSENHAYKTFQHSSTNLHKWRHGKTSNLQQMLKLIAPHKRRSCCNGRAALLEASHTKKDFNRCSVVIL